MVSRSESTYAMSSAASIERMTLWIACWELYSRNDDCANRVVAEPGTAVLRTVLDGLEMPTSAKRVSVLDRQCAAI